MPTLGTEKRRKEVQKFYRKNQLKLAINHYLKATPVEKIWGVGKRLSLKLKDYGGLSPYNINMIIEHTNLDRSKLNTIL